MQKLFFFLLFFSFYSLATHSQNSNEKQIQEMKEQYEADKLEFIENLVSSLSVDDFQKEIIKQKLNSYFDEKQKIHQANFPSYIREEKLNELDRTHFTELKDICKDEVISKIQEAVKNPLEHKKKNKRKKKNKN